MPHLGVPATSSSARPLSSAPSSVLNWSTDSRVTCAGGLVTTEPRPVSVTGGGKPTPMPPPSSPPPPQAASSSVTPARAASLCSGVEGCCCGLFKACLLLRRCDAVYGTERASDSGQRHGRAQAAYTYRSFQYKG